MKKPTIAALSPTSLQPAKLTVGETRPQKPDSKLFDSYPSSPRAVSFLRLLVLASLFLAQLACTPSSRVPAQETLLIGTPASFESVNELIAQGSSFNAQVLRQMFLWLADESLSAENNGPTFTPRLARSWEFSEGDTQLTFELRDDVLWSDGVPVTAEDVRFSWLAQTSPAIAWPYAEFKGDITDVEALSPTSVRFHFDHASSASMINAIDGGILPAHAWSKLPFDQWRSQPEWFEEHLVTNGPYQLEAWQPQQRLVLTANPTYFEPGVPAVERITFVHIADASSRLSQLQSGAIDVLHGISPSSVSRIKEDSSLRLFAYASRQFAFIVWNTQRPYFDDARTRLAIAHAVNRQQIVDVLWDDLAIPHESLISSWHWSHGGVPPIPYDPKRAAELLDEAGWHLQPDGSRQRNGITFSFELTTNPGNQERWDAMRMIQQDLAAVGIEVKNRRIEYQQLNALNFAHDFDATLMALQMDTSLELGAALHSESIGNGLNFGSFKSEEADARIEAIRKLINIGNAQPHIAAVEEILRRDQPFLFLWEPKQLLAAQDDVQVVTNLLAPFTDLHRWQYRTP